MVSSWHLWELSVPSPKANPLSENAVCPPLFFYASSLNRLVNLGNSTPEFLMHLRFPACLLPLVLDLE
jgi:hypothetical protein